MKAILQWALWGFFGVIALAIVFVKAGQKGGRSGGQQSADIIDAAGTSVTQLAGALEGG